MLEDGYWVIFIFKEQVFVPTMARTKAGFYMGIEPVEWLMRGTMPKWSRH